jgi:hypothetical protein
MTKLLVVFENTEQALQNLLAAIGTAKAENLATGNKVQMRVCILQLLQENLTLDYYLEKVEYSTQRILALVRQTLIQEKMPEATLEVLQVMEPGAAQLVAKRAADWGADQIFVSLGKTCEKCLEKKARHLSFFGFRGYVRPQLELPAIIYKQAVDPNDLLKLANCRVTVTCHSQIVISMQQYQPRSATQSNRIVYKRA